MAPPAGEGGLTMPDCKKCRYRYWLAQLCDIHVWQEDCDKYGTDLCQKMNDPEFIEYMKGE